MEALRFTEQQYLRMHGSARADHFLSAQQQPAPLQNQPNQIQQKNAITEEQVKAALYARVKIPAECTDSEAQVGLISVADAGGPSHPVIVICGEKEVLTTLEVPAPDCKETLISIHVLILAEQKSRTPRGPTLCQLKEKLCRNT